ncbi:MAG: MFS transporter [Hyphomonas sp.]|nr:MFS transporter [Hyphomonas sp.]
MDQSQQLKSMPAISEYRTLRFLFVFLLYVAQGAPVGIFFFALPAWLAANGASALEVGGFLSATGLPWTLKFINGFIMDRFTFLPMGRRRAWLIGAQAVMVVSLIAFAFVAPGPKDIAALSAFAFIIMAATTYQDVAVDGMAVDLVPDEERARANGLMFGGQSIGIAAGTAFTGFAIASAGFGAAMLGNAAFVAVILLMLIIFRERPGERLLPWTPGEASETSERLQVAAWWPLLTSVWKAMFTRDSLLHVVAQFCVGALYGLYAGAMPLIATNVAGWSDADFSGLSGAGNFIAGILGIVVFGVLSDVLGTRTSTILSFLATAVFAGAYLFARPYWHLGISVQAAVIVYLALTVWSQVGSAASAMKICSLKAAATQFTLFMALSNLGITVSSATLGLLDAIGGYQAMLVAIIATSLVGAGAMYLFNERRMQQRVLAEAGLA